MIKPSEHGEALQGERSPRRAGNARQRLRAGTTTSRSRGNAVSRARLCGDARGNTGRDCGRRSALGGPGAVADGRPRSRGSNWPNSGTGRASPMRARRRIAALRRSSSSRRGAAAVRARLRTHQRDPGEPVRHPQTRKLLETAKRLRINTDAIRKALKAEQAAERASGKRATTAAGKQGAATKRTRGRRRLSC